MKKMFINLMLIVGIVFGGNFRDSSRVDFPKNDSICLNDSSRKESKLQLNLMKDSAKKIVALHRNDSLMREFKVMKNDSLTKNKVEALRKIFVSRRDSIIHAIPNDSVKVRIERRIKQIEETKKKIKK